MCCRDNDLTNTNLDHHECITEHSSFERIVLDDMVLEVAYVQIMAENSTCARAPTAGTQVWIIISVCISQIILVCHVSSDDLSVITA